METLAIIGRQKNEAVIERACMSREAESQVLKFVKMNLWFVSTGADQMLHNLSVKFSVYFVSQAQNRPLQGHTSPSAVDISRRSLTLRFHEVTHS